MSFIVITAGFMAGADARAAVDAVTPWSISAITTSPPPYCVAMRRYRDGSILSLSHNGRGDILLSLDLVKDNDRQALTTAYLVTQNEGAAMQVLPAPARGALLRLGEPLLRDLISHQSFSFSLDGQPRSWTGAPSPLEVRLLRLCATLLDPVSVIVPVPPAPAETLERQASHVADLPRSPKWEVYDQALKAQFARLGSWLPAEPRHGR
jgi:hypothetical protein